MRSGAVLMLTLSLCAAACGKAADPDPAAIEAPSPATSPVAETAATPGSEPAATPTPSTEPTTPAAAPAASTPIVPRDVRALGTEPFWNARINGNTLVYTTPEDQEGRKIAVERRDTAIGAVLSGKLDNEPLVLTLAKRTCNDGMSDRAYPFAAVLALGSQRRIGCAS